MFDPDITPKAFRSTSRGPDFDFDLVILSMNNISKVWGNPKLFHLETQFVPMDHVKTFLKSTKQQNNSPLTFLFFSIMCKVTQ